MNRLMGVLLLCPALASAGSVEVLSRIKTGSTSEEATYVDSGKWGGRVAFLDGNDVLVTGAEAEGQEVKGKGLCKDISGEGKAIGHLKCPTKATQVAFAFQASAGWHPRGLAFIPGANEFVFSDLEYEDPEHTVYRYPLIFTDEDGVTLRRVVVQYPQGVTPYHVEGLDHFPATHPTYPNRLAQIVYQDSSEDYAIINVAITTLEGVVERMIPLSDPAFLENNGVGALAVLGDDRLLVAPYSSNLLLVNFQGQIVGGPFNVPQAHSLEAMDFYPDGRVFAADYGLGKAWILGATFQPLEGEEITFGPSLGLTQNLGVHEDPSSGDLLVHAYPDRLYRLPRNLSAKTEVLALRSTPVGSFSILTTEIFQEDGRLVLAHQNFDTGEDFWVRGLSTLTPPYAAASFTPWFPVRDGSFPMQGAVIQVIDVPTTDELYLRLRRNFPINRGRLLVFGRDGQFRRAVTLPVPDFQAVGYIYPSSPSSPGELLLIADGQALVIGLDGQLKETHTFDGPAPFSDVVQDETDATGRSFIGISAEPSEVIRFRLP